VNTGASWPDLDEAERRVHEMQSKLHQWAGSDPARQFDDLYNLVYDPAFLVVAWNRVKTNKGARSAGVDGIAPRSITAERDFLAGVREDLKTRRFVPARVREKVIPKASGKVRRLGIPTCRRDEGRWQVINRPSEHRDREDAVARARELIAMFE
jgi:RNA-directed DNA polymerase